jgi:hypothetical protein
MNERRQASRREPIEVELQDGRVFTAKPLPWMDANDLGNIILQEQAASANEAVRLYMEDNLPQLEVTLQLKVKDWQPVLDKAYPEVTHEEWNTPAAPSRDECADLVIASLEVNHLDHLKSLVDPNFQTPTMPGGSDTSEPAGITTIGQKTTSTLDSSGQESLETPPSP